MKIIPSGFGNGFNEYVTSIDYVSNDFSLNNVNTSDAGVLYKVNKEGRCVLIKKPKSIISSISLVSHGHNIFESKNTVFLNKYVPYSFESFKNKSLLDKGLHVMNFCQTPFSYEPSGHINVSRDREFRLKVVTNGLDDSTESHKLYISGRALNFLLLDVKSVNLRIY